MLLLGLTEKSDSVIRITDKIVNKVYDKPYDEMTNVAENIAADFAKEIRDKKVFYDLCKSSLISPTVNATNDQNHLLKYFTNCHQSNVVALPILFKIKNKRLKLENYVLNAGVCESFAKSIEMFPDILHSIILT